MFCWRQWHRLDKAYKCHLWAPPGSSPWIVGTRRSERYLHPLVQAPRCYECSHVLRRRINESLVICLSLVEQRKLPVSTQILECLYSWVSIRNCSPVQLPKVNTQPQRPILLPHPNNWWGVCWPRLAYPSAVKQVLYILFNLWVQWLSSSEGPPHNPYRHHSWRTSPLLLEASLLQPSSELQSNPPCQLLEVDWQVVGSLHCSVLLCWDHPVPLAGH